MTELKKPGAIDQGEIKKGKIESLDLMSAFDLIKDDDVEAFRDGLSQTAKEEFEREGWNSRKMHVLVAGMDAGQLAALGAHGGGQLMVGFHDVPKILEHLREWTGDDKFVLMVNDVADDE